MSKKEEQPDRLKQFISWVDGDREPKDRTLFVMEQRPHREFRPSEEEFERREKDRLRKFFNWYPIAAAVICMALGIILFTTVMNLSLIHISSGALAVGQTLVVRFPRQVHAVRAG